MRAEDYMYHSRLGFQGDASASRLNFDRKMQNDFLFSTGVQIFLSR
jgi:hypothetical protein